MNDSIQRLIHHFEVGKGVGWIRGAALFLALVGFAALYDLRQYKNLSRPEAMDFAQVARNLARGQGFSTQFVRPFSIHLLEARAADSGSRAADAARLKGAHPDVSNPPVYPALLAAYMGLVPFNYSDTVTPASQVHGPDMRITILNQALLLALACLVFGLARELFDGRVAALGAAALLANDLFWRLSISGLPNVLLAVWVTALAWVLLRMARPAVAGIDAGDAKPPYGLAMVAGVLLALAGLTTYAAFWLALPVLGFLALSVTRGRSLALVTFLAMLCVAAPWGVRNHVLTGNPLGTAAFAVFEGGRAFPEATLQRSLDPGVERSMLTGSKGKLLEGMAQAWREIPALGGGWAVALFLAGLLVPFKDAVRNRLRWLVVGSLATLSLAQALAQTHLSAGAEGITSENLLPALLPCVLIFAAAVFVLLLDGIAWRFEGARPLAIAGFLGVLAFPLVLNLLQPVRVRLCHPPYFPPYLQQFGAWLEQDEVSVSDIPWAVAWYGDRTCVWTPRWVSITPDTGEDFYAINDLRAPVAGLYLSPITLDARFFSDAYRGMRLQKDAESAAGSGAEPVPAVRVGWGDFALRALAEAHLPSGFPLKSGFSGFLGDGHLVLMDRRRWSAPAEKPLRPRQNEPTDNR